MVRVALAGSGKGSGMTKPAPYGDDQLTPAGICPGCFGGGVVPTNPHARELAKKLPWRTCPECNGSGQERKRPRKPAAPSLIKQAQQMVRDGYGVDDLAVTLEISRESAKSFVFGVRIN